MKADTLSIVIPAFNEARFIGTLLEQIKSVDLSALGMDREVIVIDDCSTDDTAKIVDQDRKFTGDPGRGEALYSFGIRGNTSCLHCHGEEGLSVPPDSSEEFEEFPGLLSNENPWEFQHKVRFGHPGSEMPAAFAVGVTVQEVADVAAYCQLLPATRP